MAMLRRCENLLGSSSVLPLSCFVSWRMPDVTLLRQDELYHACIALNQSIVIRLHGCMQRHACARLQRCYLSSSRWRSIHGAGALLEQYYRAMRKKFGN